MKTIEDKIKSTYPNATDISIAEIFYPNRGWIICLSNPASKNPILHLIELGATHVNLKLTDEFGTIRRLDYSLKELLNQ